MPKKANIMHSLCAQESKYNAFTLHDKLTHYTPCNVLGEVIGEKKETQIKCIIKGIRNLCEKFKSEKIMKPHANLLYLIEITEEEKSLTTALCITQFFSA